MKTTFTTTIHQVEGRPVTGIVVPEEIILGFGKGKKPPVKVTLNGYTYRSTVAVMGGAYMISLSADNRAAAGVKGGDNLEVTLELDEEPRVVEIPADLAEKLESVGLTEKFNTLAFSHRKEHVRSVMDAVAPETRTRRIETVIKKLLS
ncbi:MAG: hypothetical protein CVU42_01940 [Chloroflexi bacterium HGW-Chloroflexi-4]|nr:MAG: hypothetical protein CVU42_01940 [Chloroflexi bacterium HGW-Chloroflexi-4]